ncbi:GntR family transcriptional regulator [Paenibacillus tarimensis]
MKLDFDKPIPIYLQMIHEVKRAIARGELQPGDKIPSQRERAQLSQVNPNTVQRAYREMEAMGLTVTERGQGTFITNDKSVLDKVRTEMANLAIQTFVEDMIALGYRSDEIQSCFAKYMNDKHETEG